MVHLFRAGLLLCGTVMVVHAGEIQYARVEQAEGEYSVDISVKVVGDRDTIYRIATDYKQLTRLSDLILDSGLVHRVGPDGVPVVRRRLLTKSCVLRLCFKATLIEDVWEPAGGVIKTVFIPEQSDFVYGEAVWQIHRIDDENTMINFYSKFRPDFWVPPLIGPLVIKRMMLDATEQSIHNIETLAALEKPRP